MGWSNLLKNPLRQLSEVAISALESDWPGSKQGGKESFGDRNSAEAHENTGMIHITIIWL